MITAHTDVVGSLLRPVALRKARDEWVAGRVSQVQFKAIEDRAIDEAVSLQEAAGLDIVTDGEMRRLSFQSQMTEAVDGFGPCDIDAFLWGHWHGDGAVGERRHDRPLISALLAGSFANVIWSPRSSYICAAAQAASQR
jgi:5-methyltetrahydropteroyltriglutamate--homocysteine methyltransferase